MAKIGCGDLPPEEGDGGIGRKGKGVWSRRHRRSGGLRPRREDGPRVEGFLQKAEEQVELTCKEMPPQKCLMSQQFTFTDWQTGLWRCFSGTRSQGRRGRPGRGSLVPLPRGAGRRGDHTRHSCAGRHVVHFRPESQSGKVDGYKPGNAIALRVNF